MCILAHVRLELKNCVVIKKSEREISRASPRALIFTGSKGIDDRSMIIDIICGMQSCVSQLMIISMYLSLFVDNNNYYCYQLTAIILQKYGLTLSVKAKDDGFIC